ncbi:hypothetical protein [Natrinema ejinorense]|uniref:Uncharacterized protein n=1 Tax=Natrinema ejinorense TaxID=373386 RepID=A0A2A5QUL3_9EURY|nr:hypothetical protein [Natrinema ejinorense]PCR90526.1 hypothetical protein CP557_08355 [Natrinema ejinorense]
MGETYSLMGLFFVDDVGDGAAFVRRTVERLRDNGFETTSGGGEMIDRYAVDGDRRVDTDTTLTDAAGEIADSGSGKIETRLESYPVEARFDLDGVGDSELPIPVTLRGPETSAFEEYDVPRELARDRSDRLADGIAGLAVEVDPWLAVAWIPYPHKDAHPYPEGKPPETALETLGWVTVFGETFYDRFGGRERLLEAPAWNVRGLESGAVLVREQETPGSGRSDADPAPDPSTYAYLFEGESLAELRVEIERQRSTYVDPFRDLEDGELASDVVICESHAPFEFEGMNYAAFPDHLDRSDRCHVLCVRRDGDKLWVANTDEFVRRLVDADGRPIGDRPDGVPPDQEMISLVISTEYEDATSFDLYRMESPDDPSVVGGLLGLQRAPDGESIWQDRDDPVTRD